LNGSPGLVLFAAVIYSVAVSVRIYAFWVFLMHFMPHVTFRSGRGLMFGCLLLDSLMIVAMQFRSGRPSDHGCRQGGKLDCRTDGIALCNFLSNSWTDKLCDQTLSVGAPTPFAFSRSAKGTFGTVVVSGNVLDGRAAASSFGSASVSRYLERCVRSGHL
jgi:hypothetical protein